ncbi:MAG TPA: PAS domain S-box protein [Rubrobacter sp.]|nr:PAS domain S-box protein [Rubrobacter sp.]
MGLERQPYRADYPNIEEVLINVRGISDRKRIEDEPRFGTNLLDAVGQAVIAIDLEGVILYWNRCAEELYGWSAEEAVGRQIGNLVVSEDLSERAAEIMEELRAGRSWSGEFEARRKDGTIIPVMVVDTPFYDERGKLMGVIGVSTDITERRKAEEALRESERRFSNVVSNAHAFAYRCLNEPGYPNEYASDYALELTGYSPEDLVVGGEISFGDLILEEDRERVWEEVQEALEKRRSFELRYAIRRKNGQTRHVRDHGQGAYDANGEVVALEGLVYDVTELVEAERRVQEAEERYRNLVEQIPAIVYIQEPGEPSRTTYVSPQIEILLGYSPQECLSEPDYWIKILHPEDRERVLAEDERTNRTGEPFVMEYRRLAKDGSVVWIRDEAKLVRSDVGDPLYWLGVQTDVTGLKEAEHALKESEERYRSRSKELDLLHQVRSALAQELDASSILYKVVEAIAEVYGYTRVSAYLREDDNLLLQHQVGYAQVIDCISIAHGVSGRAVRTECPVLVEDVSTDPDFLGDKEGVASEICVPLVDEGRAVGCLNVESTGGVRLTHKDLELLVALGEHVSVALSRAQLHEHVRRSEERFRALTQNSSDIVTLCSPTGTIRYQSPSSERILGYRPEEMIGRNAFDYVHPDDLQRAEMAFAEGLKVLERRPLVVYRFRHKDGSWKWLESVGTNLLGNPAVGGYVVNSREITRRKEAEERLKEAEERYRSLVEQIPAVTFTDRANDSEESLYVSPQVEAMLGYTPEEWMRGRLWRERLHPDDRERVLASDERFEREGRPVDQEYRLFAKDGFVVWVREETVLVRDETGEPLFVQGLLSNVTERKRAERALRESEERFRSAFDNAGIGMALVTIDGVFMQVNRSLCEIFGYSEGELLTKTFQEITHPDDLQNDLVHVERLLRGEIRSYQGEKRYLHKDGLVVWALLNVSLVHDQENQPLYFISQIQDISGRKRMEEQLQRLALHDPLTGLPNRKVFMDRLSRALERTRRRRGRTVAVLFMDLDGFKVINDSLGHETGDLFLTVVTQRLRNSLRPEDTIARFGGDEFVVLLEEVEDPGKAVRVARRITDEFRRPFVLEGRGLFASASIGIALGDARTKSPENLLRDADTAMYKAKDEHADYRVFEPGMYERAVGRLELENDLRRAIEDEEFVVHYQPIVDLKTGETWGMEALVRWNHPERGLLDPSEFMPVFEESGLIVPVGESVLEKACLEAKRWQKNPRIPQLNLSVNLSAVQLRSAALVCTVEETLRKTGLDPSRLSLDVTETAYIRVLEGNASSLDRLKKLGVSISIDDFGAGYSSLSYLKRLPADILKIDKSFVKGLGNDLEDTAIVRAVIDLSHTLGIKVVAEGVEIRELVTLLAEMGCDFAQGYYFSRPLPPEEVPRFLAAQ